MPTRLYAVTATALTVGLLLVGVWAGFGAPQLDSIAVQILAAGAISTVVVAHFWRSGVKDGYGDLFHPCVFPLAYVTFSFLAPLWMAFIVGSPPRALSRPTTLAPDTTLLMVLGVLGFMAGVLFTARTPRVAAASGTRPSGPTVLVAGRVLICIPLAISAYYVATDKISTRGQNQLAVSAFDSIAALLSPTAIAAIILMLLGNCLAGNMRLLTRLDWAAVLLLLLLTAGRGTRGDIVAILLLITVTYAHKRGKLRAIVVSGLIMAAVGVLVLQYRVDAKGNVVTDTPSEILLGDMATAGYTTGATAAAVPSQYPFEHGRTLLQAAVRQLPGPIALRLIGPPTNTGPRIFRKIVGLNNPNQGVGFSIPAEGFLNFGPIGVFGFCGACGLLLAWAYRRMSLVSGRAAGVVYPIAVSALPFALRADSLGATKNVLYPVIIVWGVILLARSGTRHPAPEGASTPLAPTTR